MSANKYSIILLLFKFRKQETLLIQTHLLKQLKKLKVKGRTQTSLKLFLDSSHKR